GFGRVDRVTQGENRAARGQGHPLGASSQKSQVSKGIEHLPRISETWIMQGHITYPHRRKILTVYLLYEGCLSGQHTHIALIKAQRQKDPYGQAIRRKHAAITRVIGKGRERGALSQA